MGRLGRFEFFDVCKNFDCDLHASSFAIKIDIGNEIQISEAPQEYAFVRYLSILLCFSKYQYDYLKSYKCTRDLMYARNIEITMFICLEYSIFIHLSILKRVIPTSHVLVYLKIDLKEFVYFNISLCTKSVSGIRFDYFSVVHITQMQALKS